MPRPPPLYAFRFEDPATGKWTRSRRRASIADIRRRYAEWELIGQPELRRGGAELFSPFARTTPRDLPPDMRPQVDAVEAALLTCFLRRYVTYCARRGRFAAMQGAANLLRVI